MRKKYTQNIIELVFLFFLCAIIIYFVLPSPSSIKEPEQTNELFEEIKQIREPIYNDPITLIPKGSNFSFVAGEDFPVDRYSITNNDENGILFVRNDKHIKIASERIGNGPKDIKNYMITLPNDWSVSGLELKELILYPQSYKEISLTPGFWQIGKDVLLRDGTYEVDFIENGTLSVFDEANNQLISINSDENKNEQIELKQNQTIKISFSNNVRLTLVDSENS